MIMCFCNWGAITKMRYICIHDYIFNIFTSLMILSAISSRDFAILAIFIAHLILVNIPRFIFGVSFMRSNYLIEKAKRYYCVRLLTVFVQVPLDIAYIIYSGVKIRSGNVGFQVAGLVIMIILIIIVVGVDIYYTKVLKNYIDNTQVVAFPSAIMVNSSQSMYIRESRPQGSNQVTYIQENNIPQSYNAYNPEVQIGVPVQQNNLIAQPQHQAYSLNPTANRVEMGRIQEPNQKSIGVFN